VLSYLFAHDYIGGSGQSVRPDEHGADALSELKLALALIDREGSLSPSTLWMSLAPSLTDPLGNGHRAEINVEKLWNPYQAGRGQSGLVEFRAFRMQQTPERAAALAVLLRAILAMLMTRNYEDDLIDWGDALHDRFALPFYLEADLREVLVELEAAQLPIGPPVRAELEADQGRLSATVDFGGFTISIRQALEFWLLLGDASSQHGTSRLVDASTHRLELTLRPKSGAGINTLALLRLRAQDIELPLRTESDGSGPVRIFGVRYRSFVPTRGLHPTLGAQGPVRLLLQNPLECEALEIALYEWRPDGAAYDGLPVDLAQAAARRAARCVARRLPAHEVPPRREAPRGAMTAYSLDLRYVPVLSSLPAVSTRGSVATRDIADGGPEEERIVYLDTRVRVGNQPAASSMLSGGSS
jgi:uncharacterized protein (DUF2126 family)